MTFRVWVTGGVLYKGDISTRNLLMLVFSEKKIRNSRFASTIKYLNNEMHDLFRSSSVVEIRSSLSQSRTDHA